MTRRSSNRFYLLTPPSNGDLWVGLKHIKDTLRLLRPILLASTSNPLAWALLERTRKLINPSLLAIVALKLSKSACIPKLLRLKLVRSLVEQLVALFLTSSPLRTCLDQVAVIWSLSPKRSLSTNPSEGTFNCSRMKSKLSTRRPSEPIPEAMLGTNLAIKSMG